VARVRNDLCSNLSATGRRNPPHGNRPTRPSVKKPSQTRRLLTADIVQEVLHLREEAGGFRMGAMRGFLSNLSQQFALALVRFCGVSTTPEHKVAEGRGCAGQACPCPRILNCRPVLVPPGL